MKFVMIFTILLANQVFAEPKREPSKEMIEIELPPPPPNAKGFDFTQK